MSEPDPRTGHLVHMEHPARVAAEIACLLEADRGTGIPARVGRLIMGRDGTHEARSVR